MILVPAVQGVNLNIVMVRSINKSKNRITIQVAVGIVVNEAGQLLVAKRPEHWLGGGFWEFPGGKIEVDEDAETALKRELLEEVGIRVEHCGPLIGFTYEYPERTVILHAWNVHSFSGDAKGLEGQEICWKDPGSLNQLNMLPANRAIVLATQLPDTYLITPNYENSSLLLPDLEIALRTNQIKLMQLRCKSLNSSDYITLARSVSTLCGELKVGLLLNHADLSVIDEVDAGGIHLTSDQIKSLNARPVGNEKWVGASCHTEQDIMKAEAIGVDFLVISPVNASPTKSEPLGWLEFEKLVACANIPVYALGGMKHHDILFARQHGAQGIAAIRSLWAKANSKSA